MQLSTALLLFSDCLAWIYRGNASSVGYYMVRISNFLVFLLTNVIMILFNTYLCGCLFDREQAKKIKRMWAVNIICILGIIMLIIAHFTGLYYYYDKNNYYHRANYYLLSTIFPVLGMGMDLSLLIDYRKNINIKGFVALLSYVAFPAVAFVVQTLNYGYSLINLSICVSMILIYISTIGEQDKQVHDLSVSNAETNDKLEIATTLNRCVSELSADSDIDASINNLLEIIGDYFDADSTRIFLTSNAPDMLSNVYSFVKNQSCKKKINDIPFDMFSHRVESFKISDTYYVVNVDDEKDTKIRDFLAGMNISKLIAVPLDVDGEVKGFICVSNPGKHYDDATLLSSIRFFVTNSLLAKKRREKLQYLSYHDSLTGLYNRNKYNRILEKTSEDTVRKIGAVFIDLNGLKKTNDTLGHLAGDALICRAAATISDVFPGESYRVGGDEFVVMAFGIDESVFRRKINEMKKGMEDKGVSISMGEKWCEECDNVKELLRETDAAMYKEKEKYRLEHNMKRGQKSQHDSDNKNPEGVN